jgi:hypothetical protein
VESISLRLSPSKDNPRKNIHALSGFRLLDLAVSGLVLGKNVRRNKKLLITSLRDRWGELDSAGSG